MHFLNSSIQSNSLFLFAINTERKTENDSKHQSIKYVSENIFFPNRLGACDPHDHFQSTKSRRSISTECRKRNANLLGFLISYESLPPVNNFPCFITLRLRSPKKLQVLAIAMNCRYKANELVIIAMKETVYI